MIDIDYTAAQAVKAVVEHCREARRHVRRRQARGGRRAPRAAPAGPAPGDRRRPHLPERPGGRPSLGAGREGRAADLDADRGLRRGALLATRCAPRDGRSEGPAHARSRNGLRPDRRAGLGSRAGPLFQRRSERRRLSAWRSTTASREVIPRRRGRRRHGAARERRARGQRARRELRPAHRRRGQGAADAGAGLARCDRLQRPHHRRRWGASMWARWRSVSSAAMRPSRAICTGSISTARSRRCPTASC